MINGWDVPNFFSQNSSLKSFSILSENKETHVSLVHNETLAYDYETCVGQLFQRNALKMVDAVYVKNNTIYFIEFKGGFDLNIRLDNFDMNRWYCNDAKRKCKQAAEIFMENQDHKISELIASVNGKLVETYVTINKLILPMCATGDYSFRTVYVVVVDEISQPLGAIEETLNALSGKGMNTINPISKLKDSTRKYSISDAQGVPVFFDKIDVLNVSEFNVKFQDN